MAKGRVPREPDQPSLFGDGLPTSSSPKPRGRKRATTNVPVAKASAVSTSSAPTFPISLFGHARAILKWILKAISEGAHKFVVQSVQGVLTLIAVATISSVAFYFTDPLAKLSAHWPRQERNEKELLAKGVPTLPPSQVETSATPAPGPLPNKPADRPPVDANQSRGWTTDVFVEREE